jgi:hypothetical protein
MIRYITLPLLLILSFIVASCDTATEPDPVTTGSILINSTPTGAQIWVDNNNTGKVTPDSVLNLSEGSHTVKLVLSGYKDTTFSITVSAGLTTSKAVTLIATAQTFGPVRLWETTGTTASQPSGLDLSTGTALSVSDADHDIFYSSSGFVVRTSTTRNTVFYLSASGSDLNDGQNSPLALNAGQGGWTDRVNDTASNYFFLYDQDGHYSKMKIVNRGGGTPGNPAWVEVQWIYNLTVNDQNF